MKKVISFAELENEMESGQPNLSPQKPVPPTKNKGAKKKISPSSIIVDLLFLAAFVAAAIFFFDPNPNKYIFGWRVYFVQTASMTPDLPVGSLIFIHQIDPEDIQVGDDITVSTDDEGHEIITHRVIEIRENYSDSGERGFVTQGIAQSYADEDIRLAGQVIGKVRFCLPWLGYMLGFIQSHLIEFLISTVGLIILIVYLRKTWKSDKSSVPSPQGDDSEAEGS